MIRLKSLTLSMMSICEHQTRAQLKRSGMAARRGVRECVVLIAPCLACACPNRGAQGASNNHG